MCGRFYIPMDDGPEELEKLLRDAGLMAPEPLPRGEITPGMRVPAVCASRVSRTPKPFAMTWGYPVQGKLVINARSETAGVRPLFRDSLRDRRCLIPASAWFEWDHRHGAGTKYRISPSGTDWFCLAGLYRPEGRDARCTILTRPAEGGMEELHDRMPVLLRPDEAAAWLDRDTDPAPYFSRNVKLDLTPVPGQTAQLSLWENTDM